MSKKNKKVLGITSGIIIVIIGIIVISNLNRSKGKSGPEKIAYYLENNYNEEFSNIEYLGKIQNMYEFRFFHEVIELFPIKNSFKYYYKAYSKNGNIAFYVCLDRDKKGNESFDDTYKGFLERRKQVENVMIKSEELLSGVKEGTSLIEYDGYEKLECDPNNLHKIMSDVSRSKDGYLNSKYYRCDDGDQELRLIYKINLSFDKFMKKKYTELYLLHRNIRDEMALFDKGKYNYSTDIEIILETLDGYSVIIKGDKSYTNTAYIECKKGEDFNNILSFNEEWLSQDEDKKETDEGKSSWTGAELMERAKYNKYKIITDARYKTVSNDGGSHTSVYYQLDFGTDTIIKYEDKYIGFEEYAYKEKELYEKNIDRDMSCVLKKMLDDLIIKKEVKEADNDSPYVIESVNKEKKIYNKESIKLLEKMLELIDNE